MESPDRDPFDKRSNAEDIKALFFDGMRLLFGGFGGVGTPPGLIDLLIESGVKNVDLIGNDAGFPWLGIGKFICLGRARSLIASHIGSNPVAGQLMTEGKLLLEFAPQGILMERLRCGGMGIEGFLTTIGKDTQLEYHKPRVNINGREMIYESPLQGDVGIVYARKADHFGNLVFNKTARNTNPCVAMASKVTIAEVNEIVEPGSLDPEEIIVPGVYIDHLILSNGYNWKWVWET